MMHLPASVRVYLCAPICDMRKSFDGLHALVTQSMKLDAFGGHLFVFGKRRRDRIEDPLLGSRWLRGLGEAAGRGDLCDAARRCGGEAQRDYGRRVGSDSFRHRSERCEAPEAIQGNISAAA